MQEPAVHTYDKSGMILASQSGTGYFNKSEAGSHAGGHHFLSKNLESLPSNGTILNVAKIIKAVRSSAAETKRVALYINACKAIEIRQIIKEKGHPQPPMLMQIDNATAKGKINSHIHPKQKNVMDIHFHSTSFGIQAQ